MLMNGDFGSGAVAPGWMLFGNINGGVTGGVLEFTKTTNASPTGVILQPTGQAVAANQLLTATFQIGNSSAVRKRVTVVLHDDDFSDLSACTFWLPPGRALSTYTYRTFTTEAWANATLSVYPATLGPEQWTRLDNVTLRLTPSATMSGTECLEPVPTLMHANPAAAAQGTTNLAVTLTGTDTSFSSASAVTFSGTGVTAGGPTTSAPTSLTVPVTIAAGAALGARTVTVTTGAEVVSATNAFTVTAPPNQSPSVSVTAPANNATLTTPPAIAITAAASDTDGTVTVVTFYANASPIGTDTTSPYGVTWTPAPGTYQVTAQAVDNLGATSTSSVVNVTVSASTDLNLRVDLVGSLPAPVNPTSPAAVGSQLLLIDQGGWLSRWDGSAVHPLLTPSTPPAGLTLIGERTLNAAATANGSIVYVTFTSTTVPGGVPTYPSPRNPDAWQVLYRYQFDGTTLSNPSPLVALGVRSSGHTGGGLVALDDGSVLMATGRQRRQRRRW